MVHKRLCYSAFRNFGGQGLRVLHYSRELGVLPKQGTKGRKTCSLNAKTTRNYFGHGFMSMQMYTGRRDSIKLGFEVNCSTFMPVTSLGSSSLWRWQGRNGRSCKDKNAEKCHL